MSKADKNSTTAARQAVHEAIVADPGCTRRRAMSAFAGAAFAGTALVIAMPDAPAAEHPDAELLAACAAFDALELQIWPPGAPRLATIELEEERDRQIAPLQARQEPILARICALRARTLQGCQARARSLLLWDKELANAIAAGDNPESYDDDRMIQALVRDLVGGLRA